MARAPKPVSPECPRCGYDVSGVISTWASECPLEGKCSECGYDFQWKHLVGPNLGVPKWFFETARRRLIRSAISTSVRTAVPWKFWKQVPLHAPIKKYRLCVLGIAGSVWIYFVGVLALSLANFIVAALGLGPYAGWQHGGMPIQDRLGEFVRTTLIPAFVWPVGTIYGEPDAPIGRVLAWIALTLALMPVCFYAIAETLRRERVRMAHIARASVYGWCATLMLIAIEFLVVSGASFEEWPWLWGSVASLQVGGVDVARVCMWSQVANVGWWWCVCRFYLHIRHAFWVALLLQAMASLGVFLVLYPFIDLATWVWLLDI